MEENPIAMNLSREIVHHPGLGFQLLTVLTMTTGTMILMWLGEQITERGIGNGVSLVITINIISSLPAAVFQGVSMFQPVDGVARFTVFHLIGLAALVFLVTAGTIALTQGQRKVPIHTAKRVVGRKVYGGQNTYMPLRVNYSGVMPIIFAAPMITFPTILLGKLQWGWAQQLNSALQLGSPLYLTIYTVLILFFSFPPSCFW